MIDTTAFALPKPAHAVGLLRESSKRYSRSKTRLWGDQGRRCGAADCRRYLPSPADGHRHHPFGRGMGGSKRDDRQTELLCFDCHQKARIQRRASWIQSPREPWPAGGAAGVPAGEADTLGGVGTPGAGLVTSSSSSLGSADPAAGGVSPKGHSSGVVPCSLYLAHCSSVQDRSDNAPARGVPEAGVSTSERIGNPLLTRQWGGRKAGDLETGLGTIGGVA